MKKLITLGLLSLLTHSLLPVSYAAEISAGNPAPVFKLQTMEGKEFDLAVRKGSWTVLYFYPKAETPGCTKQACAFRDNIKKIRALGAEVFGISTNTVKEQADFAKNHNLNFILLADDKAEVTNLYGSKMPVVNFSKRWTFIIDPNLIIRNIDKDVDPIKDAEKVAEKIKELQKK
jgi:peroxiredoxin Q/BCP